MNKGFLFSAIRIGDTSFGKVWEGLRIELETRFPKLRFKKTPDLHMTVIYVGNWHPKHLAEYRRYAVVPPAQPFDGAVEFAFLGAKSGALVLEVTEVPQEWENRIYEAKVALNDLGLRRAESHDSQLRAHVTIVQTKKRKPTTEERQELRAARQFLSDLPEFKGLRIHVPERVELMLSGASRPKDGPDYIAVDDILRLQLEGDEALHRDPGLQRREDTRPSS